MILLAAAVARPAPVPRPAAVPKPAAPAGEVVDRIVARIEGDIITLGEIRELGAFQKLTGRAIATEETLLRQLIDQWIVANDAAAARFPQPDADDVDAEVARLEHTAGTSEAFAPRLAALGLTAKALRRMVTRELYLERYLDYKFRPTVKTDPQAIEVYYRDTLLPQLKARNESSPPIESVSEQIREVLVQKDISRLSEEWLAQTRAQIHVERMDAGPAQLSVEPPTPKPAPPPLTVPEISPGVSPGTTPAPAPAPPQPAVTPSPSGPTIKDLP